MNILEKLRKNLGSEIKENVNLANYTSMKIGGPARYFFVAKIIDDLVRAVVTARALKMPYLVLGGGCNIIASDQGFNGLVILNRTSNFAILQDKSQVIVDSGVALARLITEAANKNLGGMESLYWIPGTVGGAVYGNAGGYGIEIDSLIKSITVLSPNNKILRYKGEWLEPSYRTSKLKKMKKQNKDIPIILSVTLQLSHKKKEEILRQLKYYKETRLGKLPSEPSSGSIFKNVGKEKEKTAGFILDQVGAKKIKFGDAQVSSKHANIVINRGKATSEDIKKVINEMKILAHDKFGVELEEEVEYIGGEDEKN